MVQCQSIVDISILDCLDLLDRQSRSFLLHLVILLMFCCCLGIRFQVGIRLRLCSGSIWFHNEILVFVSDRQVGRRLIAFCHLFSVSLFRL